MAVTDGSVLRVTAKMEGVNGQEIQNVFHLRANFAAPQESTAVANAIGGWLNTAFEGIRATISPSVTTKTFSVQIVVWNAGKWQVVEDVGEFTWTMSNPFSGTGDLAADGVAALLKFPTLHPRHIGRKFIYGLVEGAIANSSLHSTVVAGFAGMAADLLADAVIDGSNTLKNGVIDAINGVFLTFTSAVSDTVLAYQRRRKQGVGI
jgi:hypothetical protein